MGSHYINPLINCPKEIFPHLVYLLQSFPLYSVDFYLLWTTLPHKIINVIYLRLHLCSHLLNTINLRNDICLTMHLQVLSDALSAKQLDTFHTEVSDYLILMDLTIRLAYYMVVDLSNSAA